MPARTLGIAEVERRLRVLHRRLNFLAVQDLAYRLGTVLVVAVALWWVLEPHASAAWSRLAFWAAIAMGAVSATAAFVKLGRRWMTAEGAARMADRSARLDDRLATLLAHRARPQLSRLGNVLLAQVFALSPRWEPRLLAPRRVPRSVYPFLASLAVLAFVALRAGPLPQVDAGDKAAGAHGSHPELPDSALGGGSGPAAAHSRTAALKVERELRARSGAAEGIGAPERARRSRSTEMRHRAGSSESSRPATISGSSSTESTARERGASAGRNGEDTALDSASEQTAAGQPAEEGEAAGPRDGKEATGRNETARKRDAGTVAARRPEHGADGAAPRANQPPGNPQAGGSTGGSLAASDGGGAATGRLFGERGPRTTATGKGRTFPLNLSGSSVAVPARFEPQGGKPADEVPGDGITDASPEVQALAERDVPDAPLHRAEISPEHEAVVRRIFNRE